MENQEQPQVSQKVLDRVKKLLFKAQEGSGATEAEAQGCLLQAQALMAKHNLSAEEIGVGAVHKEKAAVETKVMQPTKLQWWEKDLANVIAKNFRCFTYWTTWMGKSTLKFLGLPDDTYLARDTYKFARTAIEHLSILYLDREEIVGLRERTKARNAWIEGFISGLAAKFNDQVAQKGWLAIIEPDQVVKDAHSAKKIRSEAASDLFLTGDMYDKMKGFEEGRRLEKDSKTLTSKAGASS